MDFKAGALVRARNRDWVVLPSNDVDLVLLKPLDGSEDEITGIYLPLGFKSDEIKSTDFPDPTGKDIGDISTAKLLYNAARLSFRSGAGPFRSLAKLSFRPRSYQMVPLIMALRQELPVKLLIADDVGVGKTVEALLILKELLERREIDRFAIIVSPHLCEQWQAELKDKFGIDAVIIRSNTQARLDREIQGDTSVYEYYKYQIISIDYIKGEQRRKVFIKECPEFIIVDEAHTCSKTSNASQQHRYNLIKAISSKPGQSVLLLTATPHSGKKEEFSYLLGLVKNEFQTIDLPTASQDERRNLAKYFVQRKRVDVEKWLNEETPFPEREEGSEIQYELSPQYSAFYDNILDFALGLTKGSGHHEGKKRLRYWTALALLRGVMSSPETGVEMLSNRIEKAEINDEYIENERNPLIEEDTEFGNDLSPIGVISRTDWSSNELKKLNDLTEQLEKLKGIKFDFKAAETVKVIKQWLNEGFNPIIFCRFINTANYLAKILKENMDTKNVDVQAITSEDPDELRKTRIDEMGSFPQRVLVATDCLSEGINLQDKFSAVLHYDLPWNPNRLEQREGRIDRYGQQAKKVKAYMLYGKNNPIDGVVLKVLLRKVKEIRRDIGISLPFPEESKSLMDSIMQSIISNAKQGSEVKQLSFTFEEDDKTIEITREIDKAAAREKASRDIFAQNAIKANEIEEDLKLSDEAIGDPKTVERYVVDTLNILFGVQISKDKHGYILYPANLPDILKNTLPKEEKVKISFHSPVPEGYHYIGRNHAFVEQLCQFLLANSLNHLTTHTPARCSVIKTRDVSIKTTILLFRVRNVIAEKNTEKQLVAEEMLLWGFKGSAEDNEILSIEEARELLDKASATSNLTNESKEYFLEEELEEINELREQKKFDHVAIARSELLIESHERFRKVLGGKKYKVVEPILPMDLMGVYILLPDNEK
jgi:superfamily II DNA or RNA helicase